MNEIKRLATPLEEAIALRASGQDINFLTLGWVSYCPKFLNFWDSNGGGERLN